MALPDLLSCEYTKIEEIAIIGGFVIINLESDDSDFLE